MKHATNAIIRVRNARYVCPHKISSKHMTLKKHRSVYDAKKLGTLSVLKDINVEF